MPKIFVSLTHLAVRIRRIALAALAASTALLGAASAHGDMIGHEIPPTRLISTNHPSSSYPSVPGYWWLPGSGRPRDFYDDVINYGANQWVPANSIVRYQLQVAWQVGAQSGSWTDVWETDVVDEGLFAQPGYVRVLIYEDFGYSPWGEYDEDWQETGWLSHTYTIISVTSMSASAPITSLSTNAATFNGAAQSPSFNVSPGGAQFTYNIDGSGTTRTNAGTYTVYWSAGTGYTGSGTAQWTIQKANQPSIPSSISPAAVTFGGSINSSTFTAAAGTRAGTPTWQYRTSSSGSWTNLTSTNVAVGNAGSYLGVRVVYDGGTNYNSSTSNEQIVTINKANQVAPGSITPTTGTFGGSFNSTTFTAGSGTRVGTATWEYRTSAGGTWTTLTASSVTTPSAGSHLGIRVTYDGGTNYNPSTSAEQIVTISQLTGTLVANNVTITYGAAIPSLSYHVTGLPAAHAAHGVYNVTAQATNWNSKARSTATIAGPAGANVTAYFNGDEPYHVFFDKSLHRVDFVNGRSYTVGFWARTDTGSRTLRLGFTDDVNTNFRWTDQSIDTNWRWVSYTSTYSTVGANPRIFITNATVPAGTPGFYYYGVTVTDHSVANPAASTTATSASNVGTYPITLSTPSNPSVNLTLQSGTLTIVKADQSPPGAITPTSLTFGGTFNSSTFSAGSGTRQGTATWEYRTSSGGAWVALTASNVTTPNAGSYLGVRVTYNGGTNFNSATSSEQIITISQAPQTQPGSITPVSLLSGATFNSSTFSAGTGSRIGSATWQYRLSSGGSWVSLTASNVTAGAAASYLGVRVTYDGAPNHQSSTSAEQLITINPSYSLTVSAGTGGTASGSAYPLAGNATPAITASANFGYVFNGWTGGPVTDSSLSSTTVPINNANRTVTANFRMLNAGSIQTQDTSNANIGSANLGDVYRDALAGSPIVRTFVIRLRNTGELNATVNSITFTGSFGLTSAISLPVTLTPNQTLDVSIRTIAPAEPGPFSGTVSFNCTNVGALGNSNSSSQVSLSATNLAPAVVINWL